MHKAVIYIHGKGAHHLKASIIRHFSKMLMSLGLIINHKRRGKPRLSFRISLMLLVQNISQFILSQTVSEHFLQ